MVICQLIAGKKTHTNLVHKVHILKIISSNYFCIHTLFQKIGPNQARCQMTFGGHQSHYEIIFVTTTKVKETTNK